MNLYIILNLYMNILHFVIDYTVILLHYTEMFGVFLVYNRCIFYCIVFLLY